MIDLKNERLLVIAPHADDEVLGCYGLMKKIKNLGGEVYVQILTMGAYDRLDGKRVTKEKWKEEFESVCKGLNIDGHDIMSFTDDIVHVDDLPRADVISYFEKKSPLSLFKIMPTIVALPTIFSSHQDHTRAYETAITALRIHASAEYVSPKMVISYESPEYYFWSPYIEFGKFSPNLYLNLTSDVLDEKIKALNEYESQIKTGKRDGHRVSSLATIRGSEIGSEFSEAFHMHRSIID